MHEVVKKGFFILGIVAALYLCIHYVLPFLWAVVVFLAKFLFYAAIVVAVCAAVVYGVVFLIRAAEK
ncbi:MAG: hypothetical protein JXA20_00585 [Spirochaetes bacterium]|nr:hypothetical protein [Spirochaetota bacterium]